MALWYKAWLESRVRFLTGAIVLAMYSVSFVRDARVGFPPVFDPYIPYTLFVWRGIYNGLDVPVFVGVAVLLGLGGLQRERANGTAGFTLALPAPRLELLAVRATVAISEVVVLAVIPALIVPWGSERIGHAYPMSHALGFALLFGAAGALWTSVGVLCSTFITTEHAGAAVCVGAPLTYAAVIAATPLAGWPAANVFHVMNGSRLAWLDARTGLFLGAFPWPAVVALLLAVAGLLGAAWAVTARAEF